MKNASLLIAVTALVMMASASASESQMPKELDAPLFVVTQNRYAEGFTMFDANPAKFGDLLMIEIIAGREGSTRVEVDKEFTLYSGGNPLGRVQAKKRVSLQCDSEAVVVEAHTSLPFGKDTYALATNSKIVKPHPQRDVATTKAERQTLLAMAVEQMKKHGVVLGKGDKIELERNVVTRLDSSPVKIWIGSFSVVAASSLNRLFAIVELTSAGPVIQFVDFRKATDLEDGKDDEPLTFVDHLDIDGDGIDEVIVETRGYESEAFSIYKRFPDGWKIAASGGEGGC